MVESKPREEVRCTSMKSSCRLEEEPKYPSDDCFADEVAEDGWCSSGSTQPYSIRGGAGAQHPPAKQLPHNELTAAPDGPCVVQSSCFTGTKRRKLRKKPGTTIDQDWEEARRDAWLRQMLSDTSSDEDEEVREVRGVRKVDVRTVQDSSTPGSDLRRGVFRIEEAGIFLRSS